jgi:hypothetical protein
MLLKKSFAKQISIYESAKNDAITSKKWTLLFANIPWGFKYAFNEGVF